jgi:hypothetical protein
MRGVAPAPTKSYLSVQYELRSAKQVERRMLIDALQVLNAEGFHISDYQYTGMGSVYFVDFVLFHKFLGIADMWSVECDADIKKRVRFNRPFSFVKLHMADIADVIPQLSDGKRHLLWIDYDMVMSSKVVEDTYLAASKLQANSILLITIDVEPPDKTGTPREWKEYFEDEVGPYVPAKAKFGRDRLLRVNIDVLSNAISSATASRGVGFLPLFSFVYKDGHEMLTIGGMFVTEGEKRRIVNSPLRDRSYCRFDLSKEPYRIRVPRLTRKERLYLECVMPTAAGWTPRDFEMDADDIAAYKEIYRFFPVYAELFL